MKTIEFNFCKGFIDLVHSPETTAKLDGIGWQWKKFTATVTYLLHTWFVFLRSKCTPRSSPDVKVTRRNATAPILWLFSQQGRDSKVLVPSEKPLRIRLQNHTDKEREARCQQILESLLRVWVGSRGFAGTAIAIATVTILLLSPSKYRTLLYFSSPFSFFVFSHAAGDTHSLSRFYSRFAEFFLSPFFRFHFCFFFVFLIR